MRIALAALGLLAALPAAAQTTSWSGDTLSYTGAHSNGCNLRVVSVTHEGNSLSRLRFTIQNHANYNVRFYVDVTLTGNNQQKSGSFNAWVTANGQMSTLNFFPYEGSLAGSRLSMRFTSCTR